MGVFIVTVHSENERHTSRWAVDAVSAVDACEAAIRQAVAYEQSIDGPSRELIAESFDVRLLMERTALWGVLTTDKRAAMKVEEGRP